MIPWKIFMLKNNKKGELLAPLNFLKLSKS